MAPAEDPVDDHVTDEALERALKFIDYKPRSSGETRDRLRKWGYDPSTVDTVVGRLEGSDILNDKVFACAYLEEMLRKEFGYFRIREELAKKRIERVLIDEIMEEYPVAEELERAVKLANKIMARYGNRNSEDFIRKMVGRIMRKGYSRRVAVEACRLACDVDTQIGRE